MPRRSKNARGKPRKKRIKTKPNARIKMIYIKDDGMSPGRIVAAAEYVARGNANEDYKRIRADY